MKAIPVKIINTPDGKSTTYTKCSPSEATYLVLNFPGPLPLRILPIAIGKKTKNSQWLWNGDMEKPTLTPSIRTTGGHKGEHLCHSFVTDGKIKFLNDSTHEFAGQIVDLLDAIYNFN